LSFNEKQLKLKTDELISKTVKINEANRALAIANRKLESKTAELDNSNRSLFESNRELAEINKELADTNKAVILTNKQFAELNQELTALSNELTLAYQKIEQQNQTYAAFINIAAHELRTPSQAILGLAEATQNNPAYKEDKGGLMHAIYRNARRLDKLIKNILDVTRIEGHTLQLDKQRFNLNDLLFSVIEDTQTNILANNSKIKLSLSLDKSLSTSEAVVEKHEDLISVGADRERIMQVLYNLLDNAIKFTQEGTILVGVERKRDNDDAKEVIIVSVKDTGSGIHAEIMPKLFSKFASKSFSGTGLGLYISKGIVEAHGGKIWAENNPDGKGATFSFSLPVD
jgi:two-component system, OmpR family, sensor histidine kinase VicK